MHSSIGINSDALDSVDSSDNIALTLIPFELQLHAGIGFPSNMTSTTDVAAIARKETTSANHSHAQYSGKRFRGRSGYVERDVGSGDGNGDGAGDSDGDRDGVIERSGTASSSCSDRFLWSENIVRWGGEGRKLRQEISMPEGGFSTYEGGD